MFRCAMVVTGLLLFAPFALCATEPEVRFANAQVFWEGYDPRQLPLEVEVTKAWDEGEVQLEQLFFTGEIWEGKKVRVFAYRGAPKHGTKLAGILHIHGGGQTASLDWVRYWAKQGYVCVSHDFCGAMKGRSPSMVTAWELTPGYMADPSGPKSSLKPSAKHNSWYHWILVARRSLTLLESHPQVDPKRLGVFGVSVGGTLTWMVAGCDERVSAAVPIYGVGQNTYTFPWQLPTDPADESAQVTRSLLEPEGYAPWVICPLLFMNASNDHHGRLDWGMRTLELTKQAKMLREVYTPLTIHHIGAKEAPDLLLWMNYHLRGEGPVWPGSPQVSLVPREGLAQIRVSVDQPEEVEEVVAYYGISNPWPASRFYRKVVLTKQGSGNFQGPAPCLSADDSLYCFANVSYRSGIQLSSRLVTTKVRELGDIRGTLAPSLLIDSMEDGDAWFWWLAPTDPLHVTPLLRPWKNAKGERGFTHVPAGAFSFATLALGDPQFCRKGTESLCVEVFTAGLPKSLEVTVGKKFFQPGHTFFKARPKIEAADDSWTTICMTPSDFLDESQQSLANWADVEFLCFSGTSDGERQVVFSNLRWKEDEDQD
ncbi:MAG: alpha/beta hydrolase family protein [Planctomycetaceae bacterium]